MISDARGGHVSPGVYTEIRDVTYSTKSLGITTLGIAGETLKGPAFQPIRIQSWTDFTDYFGGTSPIKYKGNNYPKYELPYIAKAYLSESKQLEVVRVLGLSGYWAGKAWVIDTEGTGKDSFPIVVLRSKKTFTPTSVSSHTCEVYNESPTDIVESIDIVDYTAKTYGAYCEIESEEEPITPGGKKGEYLGKFGLEIKTIGYTAETGEAIPARTYLYNVSLDEGSPDYIYKLFPEDPLMGSAPIYIEAVYDRALEALLEEKNEVNFKMKKEGLTDYANYASVYRCAVTPWLVSEVKESSTKATNLKKLFKIYTISDGNAANYQVKISIQRIRPIEGLFDVVVRDFYDTDMSPIVLERFSNCSMVEGEASFVGLKIGTIDGNYPNKSKYIALEFSNEEGLDDCIPCGFLGYPVPKYDSSGSGLTIEYNTWYDSYIKPKRQYFGLNQDVLDVDMLNYKGVNAYNDALGDADPITINLTNGFHLDSILNEVDANTIFIDGESGYTFTAVDSVQSVPYKKIPRIIPTNYITDCLYQDVNLRKFTVYPYGGFDGWDINRTTRTNTDEYRGNKYSPVNDDSAVTYETKEVFRHINGTDRLDLDPQITLKVPNIAITSDYYAYLAGYMQFANPEDVDINLFATPGINWKDQRLLTEDALDVIEDNEDGRGGDALYVMASPQYKATKEDYDVDEIVEELNDTEIDSPYACTFYPWVKFYDGDNKKYIDLPATKDVVRDMAATDNASFPWFSPAGMTRGNVECERAYYKTTLLDEDTLYENAVNPIKTFAVDGVKVWGNKTLYHMDTPRNRINVTRLMIRVKKLISQAARNLIFEQYDVTLEKQFRSLVEPILQDVKANRGIFDYRIVTECTEETRDQHILPAKILIKPVQALEYISISFVVYPESVAFNDEL